MATNKYSVQDNTEVSRYQKPVYKEKAQPELRQLPSNQVPIEWQIREAYDNYMKNTGAMKQGLDRGIDIESAREYYRNNENPIVSGIGQTMTGEAYDFVGDAVTDPLTYATLPLAAGSLDDFGRWLKSMFGGGKKQVVKESKYVPNRELFDSEMATLAKQEGDLDYRLFKGLRDAEDNVDLLPQGWTPNTPNVAQIMNEGTAVKELRELLSDPANMNIITKFKKAADQDPQLIDDFMKGRLNTDANNQFPFGPK